MSIGEQIKELLYERKISQKQLAIDLNIPPTTLSGYIRDFREPDAEMLKSIASYFNVTVDYLLDFNLATPKNENTLNVNETKLIKIYRCLTAEQQELLIEQGKLLIKMKNKKRQITSSDITSKTGSGKNKQAN